MGFVEAGTGARVMAKVVPGADGASDLGFHWTPERPGALGDALEALVRGNDPGHFFRDRCRGAVDPVTGVTGDPDPAPFTEGAFRLPANLEPPPAESFDWDALVGMLRGVNKAIVDLLWLVAHWIASAAMVFIGRRARRDAAAPTSRLRDEPRWVRTLFSAGLLVRLGAAWVSPSFPVESTQFVGLRDAYDLVAGRVPLFSVQALFGDSVSYHLPLIDLIIGPWMSLGDLLGVGGHLLWLRLPTLAASALIMGLLLRTGRHLGVPLAGRLAMVLFAFLPACVRVSVTTTHYLMEMTAVAWFLERAAAVTFGGRPAFRTLALAAVVACWSGLVAWAVVAVTSVGVIVSTVRRGRGREAALAAVVVLGLLLPLLNTAWDTLGSTADRSVPFTGEAPIGDAFEVWPMIQPFAPDGVQIPEPFVFPWHMAIHLFDALGALVCLLALGAALWAKPRLAPVTLGILAAYGVARMRLQLSHDNLALLFPLFLVLPFVGIDALAGRLRGFRWASFLAPGCAVLALGGAVVTADVGDHVRDWEEGGRYYEHLARRLIRGEDVHAIRSRVAALAAGQEDLLLILSERPLHLHAAACDGLPDVAAMRRCLSRDWTMDARFSGVVMTPDWVSGLRREGALDGRPVVLLVGPARGRNTHLVEGLGRACAPVLDTPMLSLLSCPVPPGTD